ncbi:hypothetical protein FSP39_020593 [Pinctada imbricata]|uniref:Uncharacterized protein n=1 Tax=Pinctada imbricata TaxID=66713 RepID=A0AA88XE92_PINIB|nr:hypothetical protein FSP39_020593 [Pinctada imbricata]
MDFSKCRRFVIRGYNKARIWSSISADIKDCQAFDPILISPRFIVDSRGQSDSTDDTKGSGVYLEENAIWYPDDVDYTPFKNVLSAVWHSGRYSWYTWAVVNAHTLDVTTYYEQLVQLNLTDPCSHPDVVHNKCGNTTNEYINVFFNANEYLVHGERYSICIHANAEVLRLELWDNVLPEISICTDGVMVDLTSPVAGKVWIGNVQGIEYQVSSWTGVFTDPESGVAYYEWAIGSRPGYNDKMASTVVYTSCATSSVNSPLDLEEGHAYYINVRAFNRAGLSSLASSWAYILDLSPPVPGRVYDGERAVNSSSYFDEDYKNHTNFLAAFWTGFHDPHSTITDYYVSIGTCKTCQNILARQPMGITEDFKLTKFNLAFGVIYYTTVSACNTADLCSSTTSDGVMIDVSPPSPGRVFDGMSTDDIEYQGSGSYIGARWYGFSDSQSGIERYVWKVGTTEGGEDIVEQTDLHLDTYVLSTNVTLPAGVRLFTTIGCYNMAGMYTQSISNGFVVDETPPDISQGPLFSTDFGVYQNPSMQFYHRDRTTLKVYWTASDDVSHIERQYISISSHIGGEFSRSPVKINGIMRYYIFSGLDLHDGVAYYVSLICCNGAGLCSNATSPSIIMDSSSPSRGMFAVQTEHAADLTRYLTTWMTWTLESLSLAWLGFSDLHTGIDYYGINVGSTFMGNDLNEITDQAYTVYHNNTGVDRGDEGILQTSRITTQSLLTVNDIFIHLWAVNKAGLSSSIIHNQFTKAADGSLVLVRRCSAHTCDGHCVCAPQDQRCPITTTCNNDTAARSNSYIEVTDILGIGLVDATYTPSVSVLRASWEIILIQNLQPLWYEWSVGLESGTSPLGLIDISDERVWHDAGRETKITFITSKDISMVEGMKYSVFVRVWYSTDTFGDFKSDGVIVQTEEPRTTVLAGAAITEVERYSRRKDMDYMTYQAPITISWANKFLNVNTDITEFRVYISSFQGGHDSGLPEASLGQQVSTYTLINHNLPTRKRFYSNVIAFNHVGMYVTESSDGFTFDGDAPVAGSVIDGLGLQDIDFQNDVTFVGARWHGFVDLGSSIHFYTWCVGSTSVTTGADICDIVNATNVGLHTAYQANLPPGSPTCLYNKVNATDVTGYTSAMVVSNGMCIDTSVPIPEFQTVVYDNVLENSNFTEAVNTIPYNDLNSTDICQMSASYNPSMWTENTGSCAVVVESGFAKSGSNFLYVIGSFSQVVALDEGLYKLTFVTSHGLIDVAEHANKEGFVQLGEQNHVFLIYTKAYRSDEATTASGRDSVVWHTHTFYFRTDSASSYNVTIGSVDFSTGFFVDDIQLHFVNTSNSGTQTDHVMGHMVFLHEWSSIHGSWSFISDGHVDIIDYSWAIGYVPYGTQLQDYTSTGLKQYGYNNNVTLVQNSSLYITVVATNSLGNRGIAVSERVFIDMTPPTISEVNDGTGLDEDYSEITTVFVNYRAEDLDSTIDFCEWAIGYSSHGIEIQPFMTISSFSGAVTIGIDQAEGHTIYSTIRCTNKAGLVASNSSDGIKFSHMAPNASQAQITHIPLSTTQYRPLDGFQGVNNTIKLYWSGFTDTLGITQHVIYVDLSNVSTHITKGMTFSENQIVKYSLFSNLTLYQGVQAIDLYARNILGIPSDTVSYNFTLLLERPEIQANSTPNITWNQAATEFTVDWTDIFTSPYELRYEISAGLAEGGAEILQWQETTNSTLVFGMPSHVDDYSGSVVYMHIRAISAGGFYNDIKGTVTLP